MLGKKENKNKKKKNEGGSKVNCCKICPLGKHDYLLKPHYRRKSLGYCRKRVIACYYHSGRCGRQGQREREKKNLSHFKVCSSNFSPRPSHHNPASTENTAASTRQIFTPLRLQQPRRGDARIPTLEQHSSKCRQTYICNFGLRYVTALQVHDSKIQPQVTDVRSLTRLMSELG